MGEPNVWLVVRGNAGPAMALQLDPKFLWKDDEDLPFLTDVCVFDAATVADAATFEAPHAVSRGIDHVLVNGAIALRRGQPDPDRAGRFLSFGHG